VVVVLVIVAVVIVVVVDYKEYSLMASIEFLNSLTTLILSGGILNSNIWRDDENDDRVNHDIIFIILLILYFLIFDRCQCFKLHGVEIHLLACW